MLRRIYDAKRLNAIINDPTVLPYVVFGENKVLDATALVLNRDNILLMNEYGGILFESITPRTFMAHTQFLPEGRGKKVIEFSKRAAAYMFNKTACLEIHAAVPANNKASQFVARRVGFKYVGVDEKCWPQHGEMLDMVNFKLTYNNWKNQMEGQA